MSDIVRTLGDPVTYRRLAYVLLGLPLGLIWFTALVTVWSLCLGLLVTPIVIPLLFGMAFMTRGFAAVEADIARSLLGVDAQAPALPAATAGFWARLRSLFGAGFWRAQAYLWLRWFIGFPAAVAFVALIGLALGMIFAPFWVPLVSGGAHLGSWHLHTFAQSLILIPLGLALLPLTLALANPVGAAFRPMAAGLLRAPARGTAPALGGPAAAIAGAAGGIPAPPMRRGLELHAIVDASVVAILAVIWAVTSAGYFWPIWVALPLAAALAIHAWYVELGERPQLRTHFRGNIGLAKTSGVAVVFWLFTVIIWLITSHGYFWPIWTLLAAAIVVGADFLAVSFGSGDSAEMAKRIETLETTRAGAVDVQDSELRRIERDLHDGAQARLVALGMSLGMAEQKLADDPERASELLAEARAGAEHALRELRDLARGIHPPVLADRGLEAALSALVDSTPMHVTLSVDVPQRPPPAVESAAYFVAAEALANAGKHAHAQWLDIRIARIGNRLEIEVKDDGVGGADAGGSGLVGLRRRVAALDGTLQVSSPPGGPTTIFAELPCA